MKNKPVRHKEENTFKFQPFAERIANIDIDVFHRVAHEYETETEEDECYFYRCVQKWNVLNLTESYDAFKKEVKAHSIVTLPQLILHKDRVVEVLLKHLKLKNVLCLQPLLEIVVAVARDLRKEFYVYYKEFLEVLIDLLHTKDTEQLEWTFTCLAYMFKFLWRSLIKNVNTVFTKLLPLLSDTKPNYVNNFAAESFAFVARKVKDRKAFIELVIKGVKSQNDGVTGCGKLLFEVINGVDGQFHSIAEQFLPSYFETFCNVQMQDPMFEVLEQVIACIINKIKPQHGELVWKTELATLDDLYKNLKDNNDEKTLTSIERLLVLIGQTIEYREGKFLYNSAWFVPNFLKYNLEDFSENVQLTYSKIAILLLLSKNLKLSQEHASAVIKKILHLNEKNILLYYVENVCSCSLFEASILPQFLQFCVRSNLDNDCLRVLASLILKKSPLSGSGINLFAWKKYPLDFGSQSNVVIFETFSNHLQINSAEDILEKSEVFLNSLICLPHLVSSNESVIVDKLTKSVALICDALKDSTESKKIKNFLFVLNLVLENLVHVSNISVSEEFTILVVDALLPLTSDVNYVLSLKSIDLVLTARKRKDDIPMEMLQKLHGVMESYFSSEFHEVRLLTSHIYQLFEDLPQFKSSENTESFSVFSICYNVESTNPQVDTVRHQIHNLEKLAYGRHQASLCENTAFSTVPLRYLCGTLYINFQLLWEPVIKIIASHACGSKYGFWDIFGGELKLVVEKIKCPPEIVRESFDGAAHLNDVYESSCKLVMKPDYGNYRLLLWKAMTHFVDVAEAKTKDVAELVLNFIGNEYMKADVDVALTWNIKQNSEVTNDDKLAAEELSTQKPENNVAIKKPSGKSKITTLIGKLLVLSKVKNPKAMYREPELNKLYFSLLSHKNPQVQKLALTCILTYKHKHITPYRDHLLNLVDDKNFKNELTAFRVDQDSALVQPDHRKDLIPLVMQIAFTKMSAKTGMRTGGKAAGQLRRNLVLRFLAGCREDEMVVFVEKAFSIYGKYVKNDDVVKNANEIAENVDLEKFVPPGRLQSSINLLSVVLENFGGFVSENLHRRLLKILLVIGALIKGALAKSSSVYVGYLGTLKDLRTSSIKVLNHFFAHFENFSWDSSEIDAVFSVFVWPYLDKLSVEGIHSPTAILKLFAQFGSLPKYFPLLIKHKEGDETQYALKHVINLLSNTKTSNLVSNTIMETLEKLLTLEADEDDRKNKLPINNELPIEKNILQRVATNGSLNYGSCILLPHAPIVLNKIKSKLEGAKAVINQRELLILSRISELVWESDISDQLLNLLLPITLKRCYGSAGEEVVTQLLTTVSNLIKNVDDRMKHLRKISPLFGAVSYASGRKILCEILTKLAEKNCDFLAHAEIIKELNAWDAKWLDQPDFEKRHDAFRKIKTISENNTLDVNLGVLVVYNCYYMISKEKDISLRENASHCLKTVSPILINKYQNSPSDIDFVLNETVFSLIRKGLKSNNSDVRNECISLLGCIARECATAHVVLTDLNKFTNKADLEVDCFENLTHLQIHRHARALLKISQTLKESTVKPNSRTLTQFVLPLTTFYLCTEKFSGKNSLIDAAIENVQTVSKLLNWHQYEGILKYYLKKLRYKSDFQRQLVRLTIAILDSFHFDLSKGQVRSVVAAKAVKKTDGAGDVSNEVAKGDGCVDGDVKADNEAVGAVADGEVGEDGGEEVEEDEGIEKELEELENVGDENDEEEEEKSLVEEKKLACEKITVLCKSAANRIITTIQTVLLPQLHRSMAELTYHEGSHKVNRKKTGIEREEEDLVRVPLSLAVVKLLQRLPVEIMDGNLPGVFMKLCTFLKSQLESVRRATRETLQKIILALGPKYLHVLLSEMTPLLNRGFQVHVLVYTVHAVLNCLQEVYQPGDINGILLTVLHLCKTDLFGDLAEEKEVAKIVRKVSEAKSSKSCHIFQLLAQYITDSCLLDLILPIKEVLIATHSFKTVNKTQECLRHIALGLVENKFISLESLFKFAYGTASESIPELLAASEKPKAAEKDTKIVKEDCFILPKEPGRSGAKPKGKLSSKTNAHILIEFGLKLCHFILKKEKVKEGEHAQFMDPFVAVFKNCLKSRHVKLSTYTLQCLSWVLKYDLPSMKESINEITEAIFGILHKYASAGLSKGDNFDLVVAAFKTISVVMRDVKYYTVTTEQLKILLLYAEQDLHDCDRQATAFGLLKAIIARKLMVSEIHDTMSKVAELSITSELNHVRLQARLVLHQFIMEYPLGKKLDRHVSFYIAQLGYDVQSGRESAMEMILSLITSFPMAVLKEYAGTFLITLGARLVNDEVPECRKKAADCLKAMFNRLSKPDRDPLFDIMLLWLKDKKLSHRRLAAQLCGIVISVEKQSFETRLPALMPLILLQFGINECRKPGQFVLLKKQPEQNDDEKERIKDHHLFQSLQMLLKLCGHCPLFFKQTREVDNLATHVQTLLAYPHDWVRLAAAQFIGFVLSSLEIDRIAELLEKKKREEVGYLCKNPEEDLKGLTLDLCAQLHPEGVKSDLAQQVVKNLVFVARVLQKVPVETASEGKSIDLLWLTKRMRKIVNTEVVVAPTSTVLRTEVFKWIAGVSTVLDVEKLEKILHHLLAPIVREMLTIEESNAPLRHLAKEVGSLLKKRVGIDVYTEKMAKVQQHLSVRRAERKRSKRQLAVTDPEIYAKKKIKRQEKKKETQKRKLEEMKGRKRKVKRRKVVDLESDEII